jgi:AcrR family transcriptional regulator
MKERHSMTPPVPAAMAATPGLRAVPKPVGRPVGRSSEDTRLMILDQAEHLFADGGYDGTSIRDIAARAGVQAAVVGYHFGSKEELFDTVVGRRISVLNAQRAQALAEALAVRGGRPLPLETLIRGYVKPFVEAAGHGDPGWRNFATLMGRLANSPRGVDVIERHADDMARTYLAEFARALPELSRPGLVDGFLFMVSAMLFVSAGTARWERLMDRAQSPARPAEEVLAQLVPFVSGGFKALRSAARD